MVQNRINKLELTWIGKEEDPTPLEPRILLDLPEHSYGEVETGTLPNRKPWPGNMLIHGDNLLASGISKNQGQVIKAFKEDIEKNLDINNYVDNFCVIVGGESGPKARPMQKLWVLNIHDKLRSKEPASFSNNGECGVPTASNAISIQTVCY